MAAVHRRYFRCRFPKGQRLSVSWADGRISTTIYYNNHCHHRKAIKSYWRGPLGQHKTKCFMVRPRTKSFKKYRHVPGWKIYNIVSPKTCA